MLATMLAVIALNLTAGLGVLAIIDVPVAVGLGGTVLVERRIRKQRRETIRQKRRPTPKMTGRSQGR